jgi:16S rRNA (cytosine967-C5)-methyltransferase
MAMNRNARPGTREGRARLGRRQPRNPSAAEPAHIALADLTAAIAPEVLHRVLREHKWLAPSIALSLRSRAKTSAVWRASIGRSLSALLRWWGWIEPLRLGQVEQQLLLAWLLDSAELNAVARVWAQRARLRADSLVPVGDAPSWTARAEGLKRWTQGRAVSADPWMLFPAWLRNELPLPPGVATPKLRRIEFLAVLQTRPPLWLGARGCDEKTVWGALREGGLKPWVYRRLPTAAKLPPETDLAQLDDFRAGRLVAQDLASQAVALACDPDPGERWWDSSGEGGLHAQHLASLMRGKGVVICTFDQPRRRHEAALRLRGAPLHNISTRIWDGRHVPGKAATFDGVVLDAESSAVGTWRRHPDARWTVTAAQLPELVARQLKSLAVSSEGVRPGGTLVYTVATVTRSETVDVVQTFLGAHPEFALEPFPHPLEEGTTSGMFQIWPQAHDCEARFIARMVRRASPPPPVDAETAEPSAKS